jgi:hypothetical protein
MTSPSNSDVQNILPVQAYFSVDGAFQTFIGQGQPFTATISPNQSGLNITNSTINSTTIGATTPSTAAFTSATVTAVPVSGNDVVNKTYLEFFAAGISWKQPVLCGTTANITLSGLQTIDGVTVVAGNRVLVKNQTTTSQNGIYLASATAWSRAPDADTWDELVSALVFVESGSTLAGSAWYCTIQRGGTLGTTAITWSNFSVAANYTAGTGLTLSSYQFSITNTGVTAAAYGSASKTLTATVNAQGQLTVLADTNIAITNAQVSGLGTMSTQDANSVTITGGTINGTTIGGSTAAAVTGTTITANTQFTGAGTGLTGTATSLSIGGNAATATSATTATNLAGGATGSVPYQSASSTTALLPAGSNGQVLTLAAGIPSWATPTTGTVTSVAQSFTGGLISVSGSPITTSGTLALTVAGTSGGIPYFSSGTTWATSAALAANALVIGGGAGVAPSTTTTGTGVVTALGVNVGTAGAFVVNGGALGTPSGGTVTNLTGTASININGTVGSTTPAAGAFTTLSSTSTFSANGSVGTNGQVLTSAGAASPAVWSTPTGGITIADDTTTNATRYLVFTSATTGTVTTQNVSSTKLQFNPSTGAFTANQLIIAP